MKRIGVLTGGGDAPGLNAVIRAITRKANNSGVEVIGFLEGWRGIIQGNSMPLNWANTDNILMLGGTILGSSRTNPFKGDGNVEKINANLVRFDLDAFIAIGGDDTLGAAYRLFSEQNFPAVGVPKTIDNDLSATDYTFGFDTAVNAAVRAIDALSTTAQAHRRVMVVEIMGRNAGWITAATGIASGADVCLVPERSYSIKDVVAPLLENRKKGKKYNIVAVAEGAKLKSGNIVQDESVDEFGHIRLGGIAPMLAKMIEKETGLEARHVVLGHLQRGGSPSSFDRILGTRMGLKACEIALNGDFGKMAALKGMDIVAVSLEEAVGKLKLLSGAFLSVIDEFTV